LRKAACLPIFRPKDSASDKRPIEGQNMNGFLRGVCVQRNAIRFRQAFIFSIISRPLRPCKDRMSPKFIMKQCFLNSQRQGFPLTRCDVRFTAMSQRLHGSAGAVPLTAPAENLQAWTDVFRIVPTLGITQTNLPITPNTIFCRAVAP
jgi:hypothetical protein